MSAMKEQLLEDVEMFETLHREEMKNVEGRQNMRAEVVSQKALAPAIVRYINHKLMNQGTKRGRTRNQSRNEETKE